MDIGKDDEKTLGIIARTKARLLSSKLSSLQSEQQQEQQQRVNVVIDVPPIILAPPGGFSVRKQTIENISNIQLEDQKIISNNPSSPQSQSSGNGQFSPFTERKRLHAATELRLRERVDAAEARNANNLNTINTINTNGNLPPVTPRTLTEETIPYRPVEQFRAAMIGTLPTTTITKTPGTGYLRGPLADIRFSPSPEPVPRIFIPPVPVYSNLSSKNRSDLDQESQSPQTRTSPTGRISTSTRVKWMDSLRTNEMPSPTRKGETFLLSPPAFDSSVDIRSARKSTTSKKDEALASYSAVERAVQEEAEATRLESILESLRLRGARLESELDEALEDAKRAEKNALDARKYLDEVAASIEKEGMDSVSRVTQLKTQVSSAKARFEREQRTGSALVAVKQGAIESRLAPLQQRLDGEWQSVAAFEEDVLPELKTEADRANVLKEEVEAMKISLQLAKKGALTTEIRQTSSKARSMKEQDITLLLEVTEGLPELEQHVETLRSIVTELKDMLKSVRHGLEVDCYSKIENSLKELERIKTERIDLERRGFGSAKEMRMKSPRKHQQKQQLGIQSTLIRRASLVSFLNEADQALVRAENSIIN